MRFPILLSLALFTGCGSLQPIGESLSAQLPTLIAAVKDNLEDDRDFGEALTKAALENAPALVGSVVAGALANSGLDPAAVEELKGNSEKLAEHGAKFLQQDSETDRNDLIIAGITTAMAAFIAWRNRQSDKRKSEAEKEIARVGTLLTTLQPPQPVPLPNGPATFKPV